MAYQGYLVKVGNYTIPLSVIRAETYKVKRTIIDLDSYRDANGVLHRTALDHVPGKIDFELPQLDSDEMETIMSNIRSNFMDSKERKANVKYYVPETNSYKEEEMYMPDPEFTLFYADGTELVYKETRIAFIGY